MSSIIDPAPPARHVLRQRLLALREQFITGPRGPAATEALARHLAALLARLEPGCLGVYWPVRNEFNPRPALDLASAASGRWPPWPLALPYCIRDPREMHFRRWDGAAPAVRDECRIPSSEGAAVVPDVVLAPCVGHTAAGYRLGYGGGYFDRWLAAHPHVTAVGVSLAALEIGAADYAPEAHDVPLAAVVTEQGVVRE